MLFPCLKAFHGDFPGGTVDMNQFANAGEMDLIPCPGRSHMQRSPSATSTEPELYALCNYWNPQGSEPVLHKTGHSSEEPVHHNKE